MPPTMTAARSLRWFLLALLFVSLVPACAQVPRATPQEISARDQWAQRVSPAAREQVMREADRHTGWAEKRKIQYEIDQFQRISHQEEMKAKRATTRSTTRRSGGTTTAPTTAPAGAAAQDR
jgi:hypothetical protein